MYILYTALDGEDAVFVTEFQSIVLPENLRYTYAVSRLSGHTYLFMHRDLNNRTVTGIDFDDLPDPVKALIVLYDL